MLVLIVALIAFGPLSNTAAAQSLTFEAMGGSAYNVPVPLTVNQTGYPEIRFTAHYATMPFGPYAPYFSWRLSLWNKDGHGGWEITQIHHRLFLTNNPPEIQYFAIHFGYNFFLAGHAWERRGFIYHLDAGVLICNPSNTVRGLTLNNRSAGLFDAGYDVAGIGAEAAVSRQFEVTHRFFFVLTGALMAGRAHVPVAEGSAEVPNLSFHGQAGAGFRF